jgi:tRNA-Thr(GGU) m(6)t(6)A37 methyltransferase TsaA
MNKAAPRGPSVRPRALRFSPVGTVRSPFKNPEDLPPPRFASPGFFAKARGEIVLRDEFAPALDGLEGFSHIIVLFVFHRSFGSGLKVIPPGEEKPRGVFATRSPHRPNPLGMSVLRLLGREGPRLQVSGLDMIDGTPVLDIKPYTGRDRKSRIRTGWLRERPPRNR